MLTIDICGVFVVDTEALLIDFGGLSGLEFIYSYSNLRKVHPVESHVVPRVSPLRAAVNMANCRAS